MKNYIGIKRLKAKPMTLKEYYGLWKRDMIPLDENGDDEGYLIEYVDGGKPNHPDYEGYISWSPKDVFENAYRETSAMTFGEAIEALKKGYKVARRGWNGKGMFLFLRPGDELTPGFIADKVKSLPDSVKQWAKDWANKETHYASGEEIKIKFTKYICMKAADNTIVNGWLASQTDMLSDDWELID